MLLPSGFQPCKCFNLLVSITQFTWELFVLFLLLSGMTLSYAAHALWRCSEGKVTRERLATTVIQLMPWKLQFSYKLWACGTIFNLYIYMCVCARALIFKAFRTICSFQMNWCTHYICQSTLKVFSMVVWWLEKGEKRRRSVHKSSVDSDRRHPRQDLS